MSKPRKCPHCKVILPETHGFHFDDNLNMICDKCGKVVFLVFDKSLDKSSLVFEYPPDDSAEYPPDDSAEYPSVDYMPDGCSIHKKKFHWGV